MKFETVKLIKDLHSCIKKLKYKLQLETLSLFLEKIPKNFFNYKVQSQLESVVKSSGIKCLLNYNIFKGQ